MIQSFTLSIKNFFNSQSINYHHCVSADDLQSYNMYLMNHLNKSSFHSHKDSICKSPRLHYFLSYQRNFITFENNYIVEGTIQIPVFFCENCEHYHALLSSLFISPYFQYSISFILSVLYDKNYSHMTVEEICEKYNISISTLYRWLKKFSFYLNIYIRLKDKYKMSFFLVSLYLYEDIINDIFDICTSTLFQNNRRLFKQHSCET